MTPRDVELVLAWQARAVGRAAGEARETEEDHRWDRRLAFRFEKR